MNDLLNQKGELDIETGLKRLDWDTEKFEEELELFAKTQSPKTQEQLRKQYNKFMTECGWPMEIVVVEEKIAEVSELPKAEPKPETTVEPPTEPVVDVAIPVVEPASTSEPQTQETRTPALTITQADPSLPEPIQTETKTPERKELHGYIVMPNAKQVKDLLNVVSVLMDEATFKLTPKGLTLRGMDPSRVAMIDLVIPRENCEEHSCAEETAFCFSVEHFLAKTLKNIAKTDGIRLDIETGVASKLKTRLFGRLSRNFSMDLLECSEEEVPTPKITFNYTAKLLLEDINTLLKDLEDHVSLIGTQDCLTFEQEGDIDHFEATLRKGDVTVLDIEAKQDAKSTYSVTYMKEILKALAPLTDIVEFSFTTDMPIRITAELEHLGTVSFYVAPRVESD